MKRPAFKRRWTLGGLMVLIALLSVPLALYVQQAREESRRRAAKEMYGRAIEQAYQAALNSRAIGAPASGPSGQGPGGTQGGGAAK